MNIVLLVVIIVPLLLVVCSSDQWGDVEVSVLYCSVSVFAFTQAVSYI